MSSSDHKASMPNSRLTFYDIIFCWTIIYHVQKYSSPYVNTCEIEAQNLKKEMLLPKKMSCLKKKSSIKLKKKSIFVLFITVFKFNWVTTWDIHENISINELKMSWGGGGGVLFKNHYFKLNIHYYKLLLWLCAFLKSGTKK